MVVLTTWPTNRQDADETKWSTMTSLQRRDGIYMNAPGTTDFRPFADGTVLGVKVGSGESLIAGFHGQSTTQQTILLPPADSNNPRIDRVVLRLDRTSPASISLIPIPGTPAVTPPPPLLTTTSTITDIPICQAYVDPRVSVLNASKVSDERRYTADRLLGTLMPQNVFAPNSADKGSSGTPADAWHIHSVDVESLLKYFVPAGTIWAWAGSRPPNGWLTCDGSFVSRAGYPELYANIGITYGAGDGSTTFNLPNYVDRFISGAGTTRGPNGRLAGADQTSLSVDNLPSHNHGINDTGHAHAVTDPGHSHTPVRLGDAYELVMASSGTEQHNVPANPGGTGNTQVTYSPLFNSSTGISINSATSGISTQNTGLGTPASTVPLYGVALYIIKVH